MNKHFRSKRALPKSSIILGLLFLFALTSPLQATDSSLSSSLIELPTAYEDSHFTSLVEQLAHRVSIQPFNAVATLLFLLAILHTFFAHQFTKISHRLQEKHKNKIQTARQKGTYREDPFHEEREKDVSFAAEVTHFLGEVEIIFAIWVIPLVLAMTCFYDWNTTLHYIDTRNYIEPIFVVVIMTLAATRPIVIFAESALRTIAKIGGSTPAAWWFTLLSIGPILGSFITEPAAMTICALILSRQFYQWQPSPKFAYATLGLLFVNISVGGTLTHFAAPPVLMVAGKWEWDTLYMLTHFGWKAAIGILGSTTLYFLLFRKEFVQIKQRQESEGSSLNSKPARPIPFWVTGTHLLLLLWTVVNSHHTPMFVGSFIFFLGFYQATAPHQSQMTLKSPLLVGSFLAGLVIHGGLQAWWLAPVLSGLTGPLLMKIAILLTAFNDNAAVTYLTTLIPQLADHLKYSVVSGAVIGGGLTVIANAPNPAGQSLLKKYFPGGVSPVGLFLGALTPTLIQFTCFMLF